MNIEFLQMVRADLTTQLLQRRYTEGAYTGE